MRIKYLLPLLFIFLSFSANAQRVTFTNVPAEFTKQVDALFVNLRNDETKKEIDFFKSRVTSGSIAQDDLDQLTELFNAMAKKKMKATSVFDVFIKSHNAYWRTRTDTETYKKWFAVCEGIIADTPVSKSLKYKEFLKFSNGFFSEWQLGKKGGKTWMVDSCGFKFDYSNKELAVVLDETTFIGFTKKDTIEVSKTNGVFYPNKYEWHGEKGIVDWKKVGAEHNAAYCEIKEYVVDLDTPEYAAKDVLFFNEEYFDAPLRGDFVDRIGTPLNGNYKFPKFDSYKKDFEIDRVTKDIVLTGGFGQHGVKTVIVGTPEEKATIKFFSNGGEVVLDAESSYIAVNKDKSINAIDTEVSLYFSQDSIYHPGLNLAYDVPTKLLRLVRDEKATSQIAFMDSYHKLELGVDALVWSLDSTYLELQMLNRSEGAPVVIESYNYFDPRKISKYKVTSSNDPVTIMKKYFESAWTRDLPADDLAKMINGNYTTETILNTIFELVSDGFIYYRPETQMIYIRQKVVDYIEASKGLIDYDNMKILSHAHRKNIRLDLEDLKLGIQGVESVVLSDSQNVVIFPYRESFEMEKGRDMIVHGDVIAGRSDFVNADYKVQYDEFKIQVDSVSQLEFHIPLDPEDPEPNYRLVTTKRINTVIRDLSGVIEISPSDNKSGRKTFPEYPKFKTEDPSFIYYENEKLYNGAYKTEEFYFKLDPFELTGMDELKAENLNFAGTMVYGDIFPELKNTVSLQPDRTLGFESYESPDDTPMYGGKNVYSGKISMDNRGLTGGGALNFFAAEVRSNDFVFLPDSTFGVADTFLVSRSTTGELEFPDVRNNDSEFIYYPNRDSLLISPTQKPFELFEGRMTMDGDILVSSKGMVSEGVAEWDKAAMQSSLFTYSEENLRTDSTGILVKIPGTEDTAFSSDRVSADIQAYNEVGRFRPLEDSVKLQFDVHDYHTFADDIFWDYGKDVLSITKSEKDLVMYSGVKEQLGFTFGYDKARYELNSGVIDFEGVNEVITADVRIIPNRFQMKLNVGGEIQTLENAVIYVDTTSQFHEITNATIDIFSKKQFLGQGDYLYKSPSVADQVLKLDSIYCLLEAPNTFRKRFNRKKFESHTIAKTFIPEDMNFKLNSSIDFKGQCELDSKNKFLNFNGYSQIDLRTRQLSTDWFGFDDQIDPGNISIFVEDASNDQNQPLFTGFHLDYADLKPYATFLQTKEAPSDLTIFEAKGEVDFNAEKSIYKIGAEEAVYGTARNENLMTITDKEHRVEAMGKLNFSNDFGLIDVDAVGEMIYEASVSSNLQKVLYDTLWVAVKRTELDSTGAPIEVEDDGLVNRVIRADSIFSDSVDEKFYIQNTLLALNFNVDKDVQEIMSKDFREFASPNLDLAYGSEGFLKGIGHLVTEKAVDEVINTVQTTDYFQKPKKFDYNLFLTDLDFVWDNVDGSFRSQGPFGLSHVGETQIGREVSGFVEFTPRKTGDILSIYMQFEDTELPKDDPDRSSWYFFEYRNNIMAMLSSSASFNEAIVDVKPNKRQKTVKEDGVEIIYLYDLATQNKKDSFVFRMKESQ